MNCCSLTSTGLSLTLLLVYILDLAGSLFFLQENYRSDHLDGKIECGGGMLDYFTYLCFFEGNFTYQSSVQFMLE